MFNYLKFAIYQIIGFISSLPLIRKFTKNPHKYSSEEKFKFLKDQASKSLDLVNIKLNIFQRFTYEKNRTRLYKRSSSWI